MDGVPHRSFAAGSWLLLSAVTHQPPEVVLTGLVGSQLLAAGKTSPDLDHVFDAFWVTRKWLGHRRLLHWWGLPVLAFALTPLPLSIFWGWFSHLIADFIFGKKGYGRGPGVPMFLWFGHVGLGLKSGRKTYFDPFTGKEKKLPAWTAGDFWFSTITLGLGIAATAWT